MIGRAPRFNGACTPALKKFFDDLAEAIDARTPLPDGLTVTGDEYPQGLLLRAKVSAIFANSLPPFQLVKWSTGGTNPEPRLRIIAGTLQGAASGRPSGFNQDPDGISWLGVPSEGRRYIYIKALTSGGSYSSSEIIDSPDEDLDPGSQENAVVQLGTYDYQAGDDGHFTVQNFGWSPVTLDICPVSYTSPREYSASLLLSGPTF